MQINKIFDFDPKSRGAFQGDLAIFRLTPEEAARLGGREIKRSETGDMRLLEGEVTGHHHTILSRSFNPQPTMYRDDALASAAETRLVGSAVLREDPELLASLPWMLRSDLVIGFLHVEGGSVVLGHPEHDAIRLPEGTYYVGRQVESSGAEERVVAD